MLEEVGNAFTGSLACLLGFGGSPLFCQTCQLSIAGSNASSFLGLKVLPQVGNAVQVKIRQFSGAQTCSLQGKARGPVTIIGPQRAPLKTRLTSG